MSASPRLVLTALFAAGCTTTAEDSAVDTCADAPLTWESWGAGFFTSYCRTCHSAASPERYGAPPALDYDTLAQVRAGAEAIRRRTVVDQTMPVGGGVPEAELARLDRFLECGL